MCFSKNLNFVGYRKEIEHMNAFCGARKNCFNAFLYLPRRRAEQSLALAFHFVG